MNAEITQEQRESRMRNSMLDTLTVLGRLKTEKPELWELAEVVGQWVWIEFPMRPAPEVRQYLLDLGFHWNQKRVCWQHACGRFTHHSPGNPRWKYITAPAREFTESEAVPA